MTSAYQSFVGFFGILFLLPSPALESMEYDHSLPCVPERGSAHFLDGAGDPFPKGAYVRLGTLRLRQTDPALVVTFSPAGIILATGGKDGTIRLWDRRTLKELSCYRGHREAVQVLAFSPDGKFLAAGTGPGVNGAEVKLWDTRSGKAVWLAAEQGWYVSSAVFSRDGKILATAHGKSLLGREPTIRFWEVASGKSLGSAEIFHSISWLSLSPDGTTVASGDERGSVHLWDMASGKELPQPRKLPKATLVHYSPDGKVVALVDQATISLWDPGNGKSLRTLEGHEDEIRCVAFDPQGRVLASAGADRIIRIWDVASGRLLRQLTGHKDAIRSLSFSPDGLMVASAGHKDMQAFHLWDAATGKRLAGHAGAVTGVAFTPDGKSVALADGSDTVYFYDRATGRETGRFQAPGSALSVAFSPSGAVLAVNGWDEFGQEGLTRLWSVKTGKPQRLLVGGWPKRNAAVAFTPDGTFLAKAIVGGVGIWSTTTGEAQDGLEQRIQANVVAISPNGDLLAVGGTKTVQVHRLPDLKEVYRLSLPDEDGCTVECYALAFSPDSRTLAVATGASIQAAGVRLYEVTTGGERARFGGKSRSIYAVAFSPDGQALAAAGEDGEVWLWDLRTSKGRTLGGHGAPIYSLAFAPDGTAVVSGSRDTTALLWATRKR